LLKHIADELLNLPQLKPLFEGLAGSTRYQLVYGLDESARNMIMAAIRVQTGRPVVVVAADAVHAGKVYEDLLNIFGEEEVLLFPGKELLYYYSLFSESGDASVQRISVMKRLAKEKNTVIVTTVAGVMTKMTPPEVWREASFRINCGDEVMIDKLLSGLVGAGYERVDMVEVAGQVSVRGGIVDVFPIGESAPYRIELFGDTVESLRRFDLATQRSSEKISSLQLVPASEVVVGTNERNAALESLQKELAVLEAQEAKGVQSEAGRRRHEKLSEHIEKIREEVYFPGIEQYLLYFYPKAASLFDYLPEDALFFADDPLRCEQAASQLAVELKEVQSTLFAQGELLSRQADLTWDYEQLAANTGRQLVAFSLFAHASNIHPYRRTVSLSVKPVPRFLGQWDLFADEVAHWRKQGYRVAILTSSRQRSTGIADILTQRSIPAFYTLSQPELTPRSVALINGSLGSGFVVPDVGLAILSEQDILPQRKKRRRIKGKEGVRVGDYQELQVGDHVVHEQHGIGQYLGLRTLDVGGISRDYLYIQYAGKDKLFIPIEQIDAVRKYIGVEGKKPKLYALGGGEWSRIKARVEASVQELARELLALYAARETEPGHAFAPDHSWQNDFEEAFPYEETPDQLQAIKEVKEDMEKSRPMDRLLCGDVGYGKTEVALRAVFKAIMDGTQAAFLVPTTVLAQQHYRNFLERLEGTPVTVGILSRFQSQAQQKVTLQGVWEGNIDLVVGTHRLLSKDVRFRNLGLLIVDEEQRFGVRHKEKIKMLKQNLDVLTMTATPIPRTLHMSMVGVRDMSVIETPPEDRYPIQTYVMEYSDTLVRDAILREINRGGQVYFVHNRVQSIDRWAARLKRLLPDVKLAVAHGQMPEDRLEKVMLEFMQGEYEVLLSTTIVEAGLDIPNVNTIIIHDADKFGLAQLYQLRGRVGRSSRIAYAYLTYQKDKVLTEVAEKRLKAIKEFTELGSGFKIALRDLEIRGAGNILGPEQHGFMMSVGFDLYVKLLEEAIATYSGTKAEKKCPPRIEIVADAYLPSSYISDARQKIVFYQKVASVETVAEIEEAREELGDRYGALPAAADNLLNVAKLRLVAADVKASVISEEKGQIQVRFLPDAGFAGDQLLALSKKYQGRLTASAGGVFVLAFRPKTRVGGEKICFMLELFEELKKLAKRNDSQV
jgi:transcription-repair coupling factor (superfamily II helicase)